MFETVEQLNRRLPRPQMTGDARHDQDVRNHYIAQAKILQSEAFASMVRSVAKALGSMWNALSQAGYRRHSHHA